MVIKILKCFFCVLVFSANVTLASRNASDSVLYKFYMVDTLLNKSISGVNIKVFDSKGRIFKYSNIDSVFIIKLEVGQKYYIKFIHKNFEEKDKIIFASNDLSRIVEERIYFIQFNKYQPPPKFRFDKNESSVSLNNYEFLSGIKYYKDFLDGSENSVKILIIGYCSPKEHSKKLANKRAKCLYKRFIMAGVDKSRIEIIEEPYCPYITTKIDLPFKENISLSEGFIAELSESEKKIADKYNRRVEIKVKRN